MAPPSGAALYNKRDGTLTMAQDEQSISWIPAAGGATGTLTISVANITNLQQTPASAKKVMLKIFVQSPNAPPNTNETYIFQFTAGENARPQADAIKDALSTRINAVKAGTPSQTPVPGGGGGGGGMSAAMAIANAVSSAGASKNPWDDDNRLRADVELQQSLLKTDPTLKSMFMESLATKPDSLSAAQFMSQFWSTRLHLLRAHAIERGQTRGSYNVLSTLKPRVEDNVTRLNISKEQIQLIFTQHPLVKRVYDDNVPKLTEQQFWSRFFQSRLFKKLRGERISEADATDLVLDKYLRADEEAEPEREAGIHGFLNLAGNEVNNSQRRGNRPDLDMRPSGMDKVPIIRTLNNLSEKIMANVAPADGDPNAPAGLDEETWNQLQLQDLRGDEAQDRVTLNIRDQSQFFSQAQEEEQDRQFAQQDPNQILQALRTDIEHSLPLGGTTQLHKLVDGDDEDEEMEEVSASRKSTQEAFAQILEAVRERRTQTSEASASETYGLSQAMYDRLTLTHATSTEFLHQFWQAFLSGNPDRAGEVTSLAESLRRAEERIHAVERDAEAERQVQCEQIKQKVLQVVQSTGRKPNQKDLNARMNAVPGGGKVVTNLLKPTLEALKHAGQEYQMALAEAKGKEMAL
ncbi:hypothetical protein N7510_008974 [Penicillium lagena]|uniref:uncharacterized protein n=1 Tax=Penicillium lagena TaxID=94218 RepID=UPI002541E68F|nr:uncharacterized protein N7510_008974 [Penicillium lagena]KAJ5606193.1 hypothetical protein N7510_008974 [Penicillium lagena]